MKHEIETPPNWRLGQTIFNFLEWLAKERIIPSTLGRMGDPFFISDELWQVQYEKFLKDMGYDE